MKNFKPHKKIQERKQKPPHTPPPKNNCHKCYRNIIPDMGIRDILEF